MLPAFFIRSRGMVKLYNGLFGPLLEKYQLTQLEVDILLFLANNPPFDTARDIVEKRHLAKSHVSAGIESLAGRGLLARVRQEGNRKTIHLKLTGRAAPIVEEGRSVQMRYGQILLDGFSAQERDQLCSFLERVGENIDAALRAEGASSAERPEGEQLHHTSQ